jgi:hypothetical protein
VQAFSRHRAHDPKAAQRALAPPVDAETSCNVDNEEEREAWAEFEAEFDAESEQPSPRKPKAVVGLDVEDDDDDIGATQNDASNNTSESSELGEIYVVVPSKAKVIDSMRDAVAMDIDMADL